MTVNYRRDSAGTEALLRSFGALVRPVAEQVAANVRSQEPDATVEVTTYETDRAAASVTITDVRGRLWAVRDGILHRAAASAGLTVRGRR